MRFPAAPEPQQPPRNAAATGAVKLVHSILAAGTQIAPMPRALPEGAEELPAALDERVRLVGEW